MTTFAVFIQEAHKRPRKVADVDDYAPSTYDHDGRTYYFASADLTRHTVTYAAWLPERVTL